MRSLTLEVPRVSVLTEDLLQDPHLLAHGRIAARALEESGHHPLALREGAAVRAPGVLRRARGVAQSLHGLAPAAGIAGPSYFVETSHLLPLYLRIDLEDRDRRLFCHEVRIDADDELLLRLHLLLEAEGRLGDLALRVAALNGLDHPAHRLDLLQVLVEPLLHALREVLEVVRAAERIDRVRDTGLVRDDLLRPERQGHGLL